MARSWGKGVILRLGLSLNESMPWTSQVFTRFFSLLGGREWLEWAGVEYFTSLTWKARGSWSWVFLFHGSVQFSCSVVSNSLGPHEPQHARPPCPSPTPEVYPNPYPLSRWCHPTILSSVTPFSSCPQSFPALGSFQMSQLFALGGQSIGVSASTSVLPMNPQDCLHCLICLTLVKIL